MAVVSKQQRWHYATTTVINLFVIWQLILSSTVELLLAVFKSPASGSHNYHIVKPYTRALVCRLSVLHRHWFGAVTTFYIGSESALQWSSFSLCNIYTEQSSSLAADIPTTSGLKGAIKSMPVLRMPSLKDLIQFISYIYNQIFFWL